MCAVILIGTNVTVAVSTTRLEDISSLNLSCIDLISSEVLTTTSLQICKDYLVGNVIIPNSQFQLTGTDSKGLAFKETSNILEDPLSSYVKKLHR